MHPKERMCAGYKVCVSVTPLAEVLFYPPAGGAGQQHYAQCRPPFVLSSTRSVDRSHTAGHVPFCETAAHVHVLSGRAGSGPSCAVIDHTLNMRAEEDRLTRIESALAWSLQEEEQDDTSVVPVPLVGVHEVSYVIG